jgi:hypothetical protein
VETVKLRARSRAVHAGSTTLDRMGTSRIWVVNFAGAAFELELWAYAKTGDWKEFTAIRQDVVLKLLRLPIHSLRRLHT